MGRGRQAIAAGLAACLLAALSSCGAADDVDGAGELGFVTGPGTVTITPVADRSDPIELKGPLLAGGEFDVAAHRGKVVLINIWGSWCAPCRGEAPALQEAWTLLEPRGVQFLGINTKDDAEGAAQAFERTYKITYPSVSDPDGQLQLTFRKTLPPTAIPSTIVLDKQGRVAARIIGASNFTKLKTLVEQILAES